MNFDELRKPLEPQPKNKPLFKNFTAKFLWPQVKLLGDEFNSQLEQTKWSAIGLCDRHYHSYDEFDNKIFMLAHNTSDLGYWMDNHEHYLYQDGQMNKLMIVVELPIDNRNDFLEGNYSKLYTPKEQEGIIPKYVTRGGIQYITSSWQIINKAEDRREVFQNYINDYFKPEPKVIVEKSQEYEYPPQLIREVFNE